MKATEVIEKIEGIKKAMDSLPSETEFANTRGYLWDYRRLLEQALEETEVKIR